MMHSGESDSAVVALETLQFGGDPAGHLVRVLGDRRGTPGDALCGKQRFARDAEGRPCGPGWSLGGGSFTCGVEIPPCAGCVATAMAQFPGLPVKGSPQIAAPLARALGVELAR